MRSFFWRAATLFSLGALGMVPAAVQADAWQPGRNERYALPRQYDGFGHRRYDNAIYFNSMNPYGSSYYVPPATRPATPRQIPRMQYRPFVNYPQTPANPFPANAPPAFTPALPARNVNGNQTPFNPFPANAPAFTPAAPAPNVNPGR